MPDESVLGMSTHIAHIVEQSRMPGDTEKQPTSSSDFSKIRLTGKYDVFSVKSTQNESERQT
jgi:hypothetical protein